MTDAAEQLEALGARARRLRRYAKRALFAALTTIGIAICFWRPDPAGDELLSLYVAIPAPLDRFLLAHQVGIRSEPAWLIANAATAWMWFGLAIPAICVALILFKRLVPSLVARIILFVTSPIWLAIVLSAIPHRASVQVMAAQKGVIVDHDGAPPVTSSWAYSPPIPAFHLRPEGLAPPLADQARYALAQQAYLDGDAARTAAHLRTLTGAWRPDPHSAERIAILVRWTGLHRQEAGSVAPRLGSAANPLLYRLMSLLLGGLGLLTFAGAMLIDVVGTRRERRHGRIAEKLASSAPIDAFPRDPAPSGFGRKAAATAPF
ncbi:MAG: hypothetical protein JWP15_2216 [Alphaproteobacteria bacterium]|nr:hypothetical protein [Alphaproteobacteria bacterium]